VVSKGQGGQGMAGACWGLAEGGMRLQGLCVSWWQQGGKAGGNLTQSASSQGQWPNHASSQGRGKEPGGVGTERCGLEEGEDWGVARKVERKARAAGH